MPKISVNNELLNINPTVAELGTYQKLGLSPADRKPNDYLRMVARTFSAFKNTPAQDTVVTYINGFDITINETTIPEEIDWIETDVTYNMFKIKSGAAMIDNQLIDIYEDSYYVFKFSDFTPNTKYGIVVEYNYLDIQNENIARVRFIDYNSIFLVLEIRVLY